MGLSWKGGCLDVASPVLCSVIGPPNLRATCSTEPMEDDGQVGSLAAGFTNGVGRPPSPLAASAGVGASQGLRTAYSRPSSAGREPVPRPGTQRGGPSRLAIQSQAPARGPGCGRAAAAAPLGLLRVTAVAASGGAQQHRDEVGPVL